MRDINTVGSGTDTLTTAHNAQRNRNITMIAALNDSLVVPETPSSSSVLALETPVHLMPTEAATGLTVTDAEVLALSPSNQGSKPGRPHNPKRFKASVMFVVDEAQRFKVTSKLAIIWDTCATSNIIDPLQVPTNAIWRSRQSSVMYGMGDGAATVLGEVEILCMFTYGGQRVQLRFLVCKTPGLMHAIVADPDIVRFGALPDPAKNMIWIQELKERVHTDRLDKVVRRLDLPPIGIFSICGGLETPYPVVNELGATVERYVSVERDERVRNIGMGVVPEIQYLDCNDCTKVSDEMAEHIALWSHFVFGGGMCSPFTQLRNNPGGLNEPEAASFKAVARLITACRKGNPRINYFAETVKLHRGLTTVQGPLMDAMLPSPLQLVNSSSIGEASHRTRQIATNMIQFANVPDQPHRNPNFCVEGQLEKQPAPCLVSRANATSYPCYKRMPPKFDTNFDVTPDERDRLLGFSATISSGYGRAPHPVSEGMRLRTIGAAFSYEVLYATMQAALDALADRVDEQHQIRWY